MAAAEEVSEGVSGAACIGVNAAAKKAVNGAMRCPTVCPVSCHPPPVVASGVSCRPGTDGLEPPVHWRTP